MKRILSLIILLAAVLTMAAQSYSPCYTESMKAGNTAYNQGKYKEAIRYYEGAKQCHGGNPEAAQKRINDCNAKIRAQQEAEAKRKAEAEAKRKAEAEAAAAEAKRKAETEARQQEQTPTIKEYTVNGIAFKMVFVKGGTFTMGCTGEQGGDCESDEKPSHSVTLSDFWMGETEVTQALWKAVMGSEPTYNGGWTDEYGRGLTYPAYRVSWDDCQEFIRKLNSQLSGQLPSGWKFALPTEAQWEYAARGGNHKSGYKYAGSNNIADVAWYDKNSYDKGKGNPDYGTHPVKGKKANALGLYDMSGNVWEWCQDIYNKEYYSVSPSNNPVCQLEGSYRVRRGGSWSDDAGHCRSSNRSNYAPDYRSNNFGLRLVLIP